MVRKDIPHTITNYKNQLMFKSICLLITAFLLCSNYHLFAQSNNMKVSSTFHIQSGGGWDYIFVDEASNKLYVSHGTQVNVLDKNTGDSLGVIPNTNGVHGIALVHSIR